MSETPDVCEGCGHRYQDHGKGSCHFECYCDGFRAAPLSTLPERPAPIDTEQLREASRAYIGMHSRVLMRAAADEIEWLRSQVSSLAQESTVATQGLINLRIQIGQILTDLQQPTRDTERKGS